MKHIKTAFEKASLITLLLCFVVLGGLSVSALALDTQGAAGGGGYMVRNPEHGLVVTPLTEKEDTENLNPGDEKYSSLKLENQGSSPLTVYIVTNVDIKNQLSPRGGKLADITTLSLGIRGESDYLIEDRSFKAAHALGKVPVGTLAPNQTLVLDFYVDFPGFADNSYQGASMDVIWSLVTVPVPTGGGEDDGGGSSDTGSPFSIETLAFFGSTANPPTGGMFPEEALYASLIASLGAAFFLFYLKRKFAVIRRLVRRC